MSVQFGKKWLQADQPRAIVESIRKTESSANLRKGTISVKGKENYEGVENIVRQTAEIVASTPKRGVIIEALVTTVAETQGKISSK